MTMWILNVYILKQYKKGSLRRCGPIKQYIVFGKRHEYSCRFSVITLVLKTAKRALTTARSAGEIKA